MEKKSYIAPQIEIVEADCRGAMLMSVSGEDVSSGGSAKEESVFEADILENNNWDLW